MEKKRGVLLLSGGLDSSTVLAIMKEQGFEIFALSFKYGQRHAFELSAVEKIIKHAPIQHHQWVEIDLRAFGHSSLTSNLEVPKSDTYIPSQQIPSTYVPARNTIFLSFALAYAEVHRSFDIFLGINAIDYSNYPDCRPEYLDAFQKLAQLGTAQGVTSGKTLQIHAPLLQLSKAQIIAKGLSLGVPYELTTSCYDPDTAGRACGKCDACHLRLQGFSQNQISDPILYQIEKRP